MQDDGPSLADLQRRLVEIPAEFLASPRPTHTGGVNVAAVVWDTLRALGGPPLTIDQLQDFQPTNRDKKQNTNRLRLVLIVCWLLSDEWFQGRDDLAEPARQFLSESLGLFSQYVHAKRLLGDPDRREELIRRLLAELGLRPQGESVEQAADRLQTLDSAERQSVLRAAAEAERRAQQIREAMAKAAAQDAASRYGE